MRLERALLLESIQRAASVSSLDNNTVKLTFSENALKISASGAEFGEAHERLPLSTMSHSSRLPLTANF